MSELHQDIETVQIQSFPYGLEITEECVVNKVSCGSRHTCILLGVSSCSLSRPSGFIRSFIPLHLFWSGGMFSNTDVYHMSACLFIALSGSQFVFPPFLKIVWACSGSIMYCGGFQFNAELTYKIIDLLLINLQENITNKMFNNDYKLLHLLLL